MLRDRRVGWLRVPRRRSAASGINLVLAWGASRGSRGGSVLPVPADTLHPQVNFVHSISGKFVNRYHWAWFALACLVVAAWTWTNRYEYHDCHRGVCLAVDRWTGELHRAETAVATARREAILSRGREASTAAPVLDTVAASGDVVPGVNRWVTYAEQ